MGVQGASEPVEPVFTVVVIGIQMMEQMMIAQEPRESVVVAHHAACIKKQEDPGNVVQRIGDEEHRDHGADALKG